MNCGICHCCLSFLFFCVELGLGLGLIMHIAHYHTAQSGKHLCSLTQKNVHGNLCENVHAKKRENTVDRLLHYAAATI